MNAIDPSRATAVCGQPVLMHHARLAWPPQMGWHEARYTGARLQSLDAGTALQWPGVQQVIRLHHLVAVIAESDAQARQARALLHLRWSQPAATAAAVRPRATQHLHAQGSDTSGLHDISLAACYRWQEAALPAEGGGIVVIAMPAAGGLRIDLPFGNPGLIALEVAALLSLPATGIEVRSHRPAASAQESSAASDAASVAALLCRQHGQALSLHLEQAGQPRPATTLQVSGELDADGSLGTTVIHIEQDTPAPPLAWLLTETRYPLHEVAAMSGASLAPPYDWNAVSITGPQDQDITPAASHFAQEIFFDEVAHRLGQDPVAYRLAHLQDTQGARLIGKVAQAAGWQPQQGRQSHRQGNILRGRGFAYASTLEHEQGQPVRSWSAWVADVEYDRASGELSVTRVSVGQDVRHDQQQASTARLEQEPGALLGEQARLAMAQSLAAGHGVDSWSRDPGLPALSETSAHLPRIELVSAAPALAPIQLKAGAAFPLPAAAAISNAIHAATGVRLRQAPFSGEQIKLALSDRRTDRGWRRLRKYGWLGGAVAAIGATLTMALPWRTEIAPIPRPDPQLYSAATIERGRLVALAGDCAVCHTAPGGTPNAGGHALQTPFGTLYSTNITPDEKTGIGNWSYAAFERAMREGIHRDGRQLYPAFPYTAFAKISEADLQSLYAYLMAQPAVSSTPPENALRFPFNMRPLLAGWNTLFHSNTAFQPDPDRSVLWNRGAYLVEGAGHCAACHSPRNALGAEKGGRHYLSGGSVDGWEAPALTALSKSPSPWTEEDLFAYLRSGFSARHGIAAGPMAPVVAELAQLPAGDVRAIAHYLASFQQTDAGSSGAAATASAAAPAVTTVAAPIGLNQAQLLSQSNGKRLFQGACAACHQEGSGPTLFGVRPSLGVNTNLHSDSPDNLIHVILHGIREPANPALGYMPGFANSFSDAQVADLLAYLRSEFAAGKPAWQGVQERITRSRGQTGH